MADKCDSCKHYSQLKFGGSDGFAEHWNCQNGNCVFCTGMGKRCKDYEEGENDGGQHHIWDDDDEE